MADRDSAEIPDVAAERKKQWVLLTNEIVSKDEKAVKRAQKGYIAALAEYVVSSLGDHPNASTVDKEL